MRHTLFAIGLMLTFAAPAKPGPLEDATAAYEEGDYVAAHRAAGSGIVLDGIASILWSPEAPVPEHDAYSRKPAIMGTA